MSLVLKNLVDGLSEVWVRVGQYWRVPCKSSILADLCGPAGDEDEEVDEDSVSDRYLVGLLAPQQRRISAETVNKSVVADEVQDELFREVDYQQPELLDELAVVGKGTVEEGTAEDAIKNCDRTLQRIQSGLTLLQTNPEAAEVFRFMNQAMHLQRLRSIYSEEVRQGKAPELDKIPNPTWFPFQLAFILLNLPSITDLHHCDQSHETDAVADLLWFPTGGGKTEAYLGLTAYTIGLRRLQGVIAGRSGEYGVAVLMRYTLQFIIGRVLEIYPTTKDLSITTLHFINT